MKVKKRYFLKKKKIKEIKKALGDYETLIKNKDKVEVLETEPNNFILINGEPNIILIDNKPYPTLKALLNNPEIKNNTVTVDMGAVKFMTKGADVMSPGITEADENIKPGDIVQIVDETHHKPLAIGISMLTGEEMVENTSGKAIETLHYVGDKIWEFEI